MTWEGNLIRRVTPLPPFHNQKWGDVRQRSTRNTRRVKGAGQGGVRRISAAEHVTGNGIAKFGGVGGGANDHHTLGVEKGGNGSIHEKIIQQEQPFITPSPVTPELREHVEAY